LNRSFPLLEYSLPFLPSLTQKRRPDEVHRDALFD
jgi:hypothetical protein